MLDQILSDAHRELLARQRALLGRLEEQLGTAEAEPADRKILRESIEQLEELFLLVVVGEFNAGKSTFINALVGKRVLPEGVTPTTTRIHILRHGESEERVPGPGESEIVSAPVDLLRQLQIVDTPGTNALERKHEAITEEFIPRSDLVLFVTSADRPFTESERAFIQRIRDWGKKLVLVVNKVDFLRLDTDVEQVAGFMEENSRRLLGFAPRIFTVSSQKALEAKLSGGDSRLWEESRFAPLERYLVETLDDNERVRLKLLNPLGVGIRLSERYLDAAGGRLELLREDVQALDNVKRQLDLYREDLDREFHFRLADVDNLLHDFEKRGDEFFEETLRLPRAFELLNKEKVKNDFQRKVIADLPQAIEGKVDGIIDWLVAEELRQWKAVDRHLAERRTHHSDRLVGELGSFDYDRSQLLETVGRAARRTVDSYDREKEASRLAEGVQTAVAGTALLEVGAVGLGAIVTLMATTQLADITGLMAAGTLAVLGLFVLPARRRRAKRQLSRKVGELRGRLMSSLTDQFGRELDRSIQKIREAISPYSRFVRSEQERLEELRQRLDDAREQLDSLRREIDAL